MNNKKFLSFQEKRKKYLFRHKKVNKTKKIDRKLKKVIYEEKTKSRVFKQSIFFIGYLLYLIFVDLLYLTLVILISQLVLIPKQC